MSTFSDNVTLALRKAKEIVNESKAKVWSFLEKGIGTLVDFALTGLRFLGLIRIETFEPSADSDLPLPPAGSGLEPDRGAAPAMTPRLAAEIANNSQRAYETGDDLVADFHVNNPVRDRGMRDR